MSNAATYASKQILSATQILSLNTSPILVIPGQAGCIIDVVSVYFRYIHGSVAFNPGAHDSLVYYYGTPVNASNTLKGVVTATGFVDQAADESVWGSPGLVNNAAFSSNQSVPLSSVEGQGLYLSQYDTQDSFPTGANWTQGNGQIAVFLRWAYISIGAL
jgi:hypothetical protein